MTRTRTRSTSSPLFLAVLCASSFAVSACSGVAPGAVRDTTSSITAQVALAKASLVACRGGDRGQCDSAERNLDAIASANAQLDKLTEP